jgi:hypothetical protein
MQQAGQNTAATDKQSTRIHSVLSYSTHECSLDANEWVHIIQSSVQGNVCVLILFPHILYHSFFDLLDCNPEY